MLLASRYDIARMKDDTAAKGWLALDLARKCRPPVAASTVGRFFDGTHQTARMAKRLSRALGHGPDYYLIRAEEAVA